MSLRLFVLDITGAPVAAPDHISYGLALLDPRRVLGSNNIVIPNGSIWIQTEFIGADDDGTMSLWQTLVEWSSMLGHSRALTRYTSAADAVAGHAMLLTAMQSAAGAMNTLPTGPIPPPSPRPLLP